MTAAYRLRGIGWAAVLVGIVLGFYLVSLRVAAERQKLDGINARIESAERDIRALETEFDTRANLAQLERWNGDTLALASPVAGQFVADDAQLATLDPNAPALPAGPGVKTAALVVPSLPETLSVPVIASAGQVAGTLRVAGAVGSPAANPIAPQITQAVAFRIVVPTGRTAPAVARMVAAAQGQAAVARVRPQAVAMLDRKLLSDTTFGDIMAGARAEARNR